MISQTSKRACDLHLLEETLKKYNKNVSLLEENVTFEKKKCINMFFLIFFINVTIIWKQT